MNCELGFLNIENKGGIIRDPFKLKSLRKKYQRDVFKDFYHIGIIRLEKKSAYCIGIYKGSCNGCPYVLS
jgi:hypothetical protein